MLKVPPPPTEDPPEGWQSRPKPRTYPLALDYRVKILEHDLDIIKTRMPGVFKPNPKRTKSVLSTLKEVNEEFGGKSKRSRSKRGKSKRGKSKRGKPVRKKLTRKKSKRLSRRRR